MKQLFKGKRRSDIIIPRIIRKPKTGGFLPLMPLISAIGALGGLRSKVKLLIQLKMRENNWKKIFVIITV